MYTINERQDKILQILLNRKRISVSHIADICGVSLVTIRKDLTALEERRLIRRIQGYAELNTDTIISCRLATNYALKQAIARRAANFVQDGDSLFIESGSTCILLAAELSRRGIHATIITNSTYMASYLGTSSAIHLVLIGGEYQAEFMSTVGPLAKKNAETFHVKYFFCGTDGYSPGIGFTGDDLQRTEIIREMASHSDNLIILSESEKFKHAGTLPLFSPEEVDILITDSSSHSDDIIKELTVRNVRVIIASE
jgi:DeoR/GlpR family transcriptional regulator of sugar metabolism